MRYSELILLEPRIAGIMDALTPGHADREQYRRYENAKSRLAGLVGFGASVPVLSTSEAYDCAIQEAARRLGI